MKGTRPKIFRARNLRALGVMAAMVMSLVLAASASAAPKGEYAVFAQCPATNPEVTSCLAAKTESGEVSLGSQKVPIEQPITLQGGLHENPSTGVLTVVAATNGETLTKAVQKVPGGLLSLVECKKIENLLLRITCEVTIENPALIGVNAVTELAAPASSVIVNPENLLAESGTALVLPVKVHLENTLLGSSCYIGSNSSPVKLELTTGTTSPPPPAKPLTGSSGTLVFGSEGVLNVTKNVLVGNTFTTPGASGCGTLGLLDPVIDWKLGLPAGAGKSSAVLKGTLHLAGAAETREHS